MENFIRYDTHLMMELSLLEQSASAMDMLLSIWIISDSTRISFGKHFINFQK